MSALITISEEEFIFSNETSSKEKKALLVGIKSISFKMSLFLFNSIPPKFYKDLE